MAFSPYHVALVPLKKKKWKPNGLVPKMMKFTPDRLCNSDGENSSLVIKKTLLDFNLGDI